MCGLNFTPSASDDIILNHQSKIIPNEQSAGFNYSEDLIPSRVVSSNSALNNVASEQLIRHQSTGGEHCSNKSSQYTISRNIKEARSFNKTPYKLHSSHSLGILC